MFKSTYNAGYQAAFEKLAIQSIATVTVTNNGKMLMGIRRDNGKFTQPGGHVENGESALDGAKRELMEEAGIDLPLSKFKHQVTKTVPAGKGKKLRIHSYRVDFKGTPPNTTMKNDPDKEVRSWKWMNPDNSKMLGNLHVPMENNVVLQHIMREGIKVKNSGLSLQNLRRIVR